MNAETCATSDNADINAKICATSVDADINAKIRKTYAEHFLRALNLFTTDRSHSVMKVTKSLQ